MKKLLVVVLFVAVLVFAAFAPRLASAGGHPCFDYKNAAGVLWEKHQEVPAARGLNAGGNLVVLFRTVDGATWTILTVNPTGRACLVGAGTDWGTLDWEAPKPEVSPQSF